MTTGVPPERRNTGDATTTVVPEYVREIAQGVGENVKQIVIDSLSATVVWIILYLFHFLPRLMPVPGWASILIVHIHQAGSVGVVVILVFYLLNDMVQQHQRGQHGQGERNG